VKTSDCVVHASAARDIGRRVDIVGQVDVETYDGYAEYTIWLSPDRAVASHHRRPFILRRVWVCGHDAQSAFW
jgi:hypothetical protein